MFVHLATLAAGRPDVRMNYAADADKRKDVARKISLDPSSRSFEIAEKEPLDLSVRENSSKISPPPRRSTFSTLFLCISPRVVAVVRSVYPIWLPSGGRNTKSV
jgi:hypothetical protein